VSVATLHEKRGTAAIDWAIDDLFTENSIHKNGRVRIFESNSMTNNGYNS